MAELLKDREIRRILGTGLKRIDDQFKPVSNEYAEIHASIRRLGKGLDEIRKAVEGIKAAQDGISGRVRQVVREELPAIQDRWLVLAGSGLFALIGIGISVFSSEAAIGFLMRHGAWIGPLLTIVTAGIFFWRLRQKRPDKRED